MLRRALCLGVLTVTAAAAPAFGADYLGPKQVEKTRNVDGIVFQITVYDSQAGHAGTMRAVDEALGLIGSVRGRLAALFPGPASEGQSFELDDDTYRMLKEALRISRLSGGAYDVAAGPLKALWREARQKGTPPSPEAVEAERAKGGAEAFELTESKKLLVRRAGVHLDLEEIGASHALDLAAALLEEKGVTSAVLSGGRSLRLVGLSPEGRSWRVGLEHPRQMDDYAATIELDRETAVSSATDADDFFIFENKRFPLWLDARTGAPPQNWMAGATVVAKSALLADLVSQAFFALGPQEGFEMVEKLKEEGVEAVSLEETSQKKLLLSSSESLQTLLKDINL